MGTCKQIGVNSLAMCFCHRQNSWLPSLRINMLTEKLMILYGSPLSSFFVKSKPIMWVCILKEKIIKLTRPPLRNLVIMYDLFFSTDNEFISNLQASAKEQLWPTVTKVCFSNVQTEKLSSFNYNINSTWSFTSKERDYIEPVDQHNTLFCKRQRQRKR